MAIQHMLVDIDTLQTLAYQYMGDATRWEEIADYNNLEYPYILSDSSELTNLYGHGYVEITRGNYNQAVTIKTGWQFKTKPNLYIGGLSKYFEVTEDTVIPAGVSTWSIPCRCTVPGTFGNVAQGTICAAGDNTLAESNISFVAITNPASFTGGQDLRVLVTGDTIYIPSSSSEASSTDINTLIDTIGGSDLILDMEGSLQFDVASGDLTSVSGALNIKYAVASRLGTELADLILHPEYGTELDELIGSADIANREQLASIAILRSMAKEDRITDPEVLTLTLANDEAHIAVTYKIAGTDTSDSIIVTRSR